MKKFIAILVSVLLWCNVGFTKDLTGLFLLCSWQPSLSNNTNEFIGFEFISEKQLKISRANGSDFIDASILEYKTDERDVFIFSESGELTYELNRFTLALRRVMDKFKCEITKSSFNEIEEFLKVKAKENKKQE